MLAKLAEDDRIEQMNAQKRRMKQLEHKRAVEKLIEDRRRQFIADKVREMFSFAVGLSQNILIWEYFLYPMQQGCCYKGKVTRESQRNGWGQKVESRPLF